MTPLFSYVRLSEVRPQVMFFMKKNKKALYFVLFALDLAITVFLLTVSIIRLVKLSTLTTAEILTAKGFFGYLRNHTTFYFCFFVLPLFLLLAANIFGLVFYVRKSAKAEPVKMDQLSDEQKAQLRKELREELKEQEKPDSSDKK